MRCLLVDDNAAFLESARALLGRQGVTVAGTASSTADALRQASVLRPDVAVVDVGLGGESGLDLADYLTKAGVPVIMVSTGSAADYADLVDESPAVGFLPKTELSAAGIRRILAQASGRQGR
jgi:DNA-binding NarL/FixJ family response regulator